mmetsp:Transcript_8317/g.25053  ORF Transcript_8317/g.25053 Transcript_8317/m.25053 type:complete len:364 (-) Transcript_8317:486-1577(-)
MRRPPLRTRHQTRRRGVGRRHRRAVRRSRRRPVRPIPRSGRVGDDDENRPPLAGDPRRPVRGAEQIDASGLRRVRRHRVLPQSESHTEGRTAQRAGRAVPRPPRGDLCRSRGRRRRERGGTAPRGRLHARFQIVRRFAVGQTPSRNIPRFSHEEYGRSIESESRHRGSARTGTDLHDTTRPDGRGAACHGEEYVGWTHDAGTSTVLSYFYGWDRTAIGDGPRREAVRSVVLRSVAHVGGHADVLWVFGRTVEAEYEEGRSMGWIGRGEVQVFAGEWVQGIVPSSVQAPRAGILQGGIGIGSDRVSQFRHPGMPVELRGGASFTGGGSVLPDRMSRRVRISKGHGERVRVRIRRKAGRQLSLRR